LTNIIWHPEMDNVLVYPSKKQLLWQSIEESIEPVLAQLNSRQQEKVKQELLDSINQFENYFSSYELSLPDFSSSDHIKAVKNRMEVEFKQKSDLLITVVGLNLANILKDIS